MSEESEQDETVLSVEDIQNLCREAEVVEYDPLVVDLATAIRATNESTQRVNEINAHLQKASQQVLIHQGEQSALWKVFLGKSKLTPDQAIEQNYKGIRDALGG